MLSAKKSVRTLLALMVTGFLFVLSPVLSWAQTDADLSERTISDEIVHLLSRPEMPTRAQYLEEMEKLSNALKSEALNTFERSILLQMLGVTQWELGRPEKSIESFEAAIEADGLNPGEARNLRQNITLLWKGWRSELTTQGLEEEAFVVGKQMYELGLIAAQSELIQLAELYGQFDAPFWGAELLETEMDRGRVEESDVAYLTLGDLWYGARDYDKAETAYSKIKTHTRKAEANSSKLRGAGAYSDYFQSWADAAGKVGRCDGVEAAMRELKSVAYDDAKVWILIGTCHYGVASELRKEGCWSRNGSDGQARFAAQNAAMKAFGHVPDTHREYLNAKRWIDSIVQQRRRSIDPECGFDVKKDLCYIKIRQAYDAEVFTGTFELQETCKAYKPEFDRLYRQKVKPRKTDLP